MEEQKKRRTATKKALEQFRADSPEFTDERIIALVETLYPGKYDSLEVGIEIVKELYRESLELTEENFNKTLSSLAENRKLLKYDIAYNKEAKLAQKQRDLIEKIYKDASVRTVYLSQYPEFDEELRNYFNSLHADKTLAQKFYTLFCNYQFNGVPPFHTYSEPNGDIIFTKQKRSLSDYNQDGTPKGVSNISNTYSTPKSSSSSGCLGVILFFLLLVIGGLSAKAQYGKFSISEYTNRFNEPYNTETTDILTNAFAFLGDSRVTLTFGGYNAFCISWDKPLDPERTVYTREGKDLYSNEYYHIWLMKADHTYKWILQITFRKGVTRTFYLKEQVEI